MNPRNFYYKYFFLKESHPTLKILTLKIFRLYGNSQSSLLKNSPQGVVHLAISEDVSPQCLLSDLPIIQWRQNITYCYYSNRMYWLLWQHLLHIINIDKQVPRLLIVSTMTHPPYRPIKSHLDGEHVIATLFPVSHLHSCCCSNHVFPHCLWWACRVVGGAVLRYFSS